MQPIEIQQTLRKNMVWTSNYCDKHKYYKEGVEHVIPMRMMLIQGEERCPRCALEQAEEKLRLEVQKKFDSECSLKNHRILYDKSIVTDNTVLAASFTSFIAVIPEEIANKQLCLDIVKRLKQGDVFNVFLQGNQGAGKSHLAYSILKELNQPDSNKSCLFISVDEMMRLIRDSYQKKENRYSEQYFVQLLSKVDYLVLDDIGAETGSIDTNKVATDFVQRVLYAVTNARQDKVTIVTTNLDSKRLFSVYDKKLVSRLLRNPKFILFKESKDKRITSLPF